MKPEPSPSSRASYADLEARIAAWAGDRRDLIAGVVVGSRSRPVRPADEWSDLDLIFFSTAPAGYLQDAGWLGNFGELWASYLDATGSGYPEWFALYPGGLKMDIVFVPVPAGEAPDLPGMLASFDFQDVITRGVRILFDKTGFQGDLPAFSGAAALPPLPADSDFRAAIDRFWINTAKALKLIQRGDLWRAKQTCDGELKACLLTMLEWHARCVYNPGQDTWYDGRFLSTWADPRAQAALPATFPAYDQVDLRRALLAILDLYTWLARETARALGFSYPCPNDTAILTWLLETFS